MINAGVRLTYSPSGFGGGGGIEATSCQASFQASNSFISIYKSNSLICQEQISKEWLFLLRLHRDEPGIPIEGVCLT